MSKYMSRLFSLHTYYTSIFSVRVFLYVGVLCIGYISLISCVPQYKQKADVHSTELSQLSLSYPFSVVATTAMIADVVKNIVGNKAEVIQIIPNGLDPHTYIPSRTDIVRISQADIIVYNGLHLEGSLNNALARLSDKKNIISMAELLERVDFFVDEQKKTDPHIWMNVSIWNQAVEHLGNIFATIDPKNKDFYVHNQREYSYKLIQLHTYINNMLQTIPEKSRILITSHDAFQYFAEGYQFTVYGIQGISTTSEASLLYINFLVSLIIEKEVSAVFVETSISPKYIQVLIEGVESNGKNVKNGGSLYADAMGNIHTYEGTYIGMMDFNAKNNNSSFRRYCFVYYFFRIYGAKLMMQKKNIIHKTPKDTTQNTDVSSKGTGKKTTN